MIKSLAKAAQVFSKDKYLDLARRAMEFLEKNNWQGIKLVGSVTQGVTGPDAVLDDYAAYGLACAALYDATWDLKYLLKARDVARKISKNFRHDSGAYILGSLEGLRSPVIFDEGAQEGGNAMVAKLFLKLNATTFNDEYARPSWQLFRAFGKILNAVPQSVVGLADAYALWQSRRITIVLTGPSKEELKKRFRDDLKNLSPQVQLLVLTKEDEIPQEDFFQSFDPGTLALYQCAGSTCEEAITQEEEIHQQLKNYHISKNNMDNPF